MHYAAGYGHMAVLKAIQSGLSNQIMTSGKMSGVVGGDREGMAKRFLECPSQQPLSSDSEEMFFLLLCISGHGWWEKDMDFAFWMWVFPENWDTPKWMVKIMENLIQMDDFGGKTTLFSETSVWHVKNMTCHHGKPDLRQRSDSAGCSSSEPKGSGLEPSKITLTTSSPSDFRNSLKIWVRIATSSHNNNIFPK